MLGLSPFGRAAGAAFPDRFGPVSAAIEKTGAQAQKPALDRTLSAQALALQAVDAQRHFARADELSRTATTDGQRRKALAEYAAGIRISPWFPDGYLEAALVSMDLRDNASALTLLRAYRVVGHDPVLLKDTEAMIQELYGVAAYTGAVANLREKLGKAAPFAVARPPAAKRRPAVKKTGPVASPSLTGADSVFSSYANQEWDVIGLLPPPPIQIWHEDLNRPAKKRILIAPPEAMRRLAGDWTAVSSEFPEYTDQVKISVGGKELVVRYRLGGVWFELAKATFAQEPPYAQWEHGYGDGATALLTPEISPGASQITFDLLLMYGGGKTFYTQGRSERWTLTRRR